MEQAVVHESGKRDTRWKPGQSGNPRGAISRKARHAEMLTRLASDMGGIEALSPGDLVLLGRACDLLLARTSTSEEKTRITNTAMRIVNQVRRRTESARKVCRGRSAGSNPPSLRERLAAGHSA
jgi:hypothetical protein